MDDVCYCTAPLYNPDVCKTCLDNPTKPKLQEAELNTEQLEFSFYLDTMICEE